MTGAINFKHEHFKSASSALTKDFATDMWQSFATNYGKILGLSVIRSDIRGYRFLRTPGTLLLKQVRRILNVFGSRSLVFIVEISVRRSFL